MANTLKTIADGIAGNNACTQVCALQVLVAGRKFDEHHTHILTYIHLLTVQVSIAGSEIEFYEFDEAGHLAVKSKQSLQVRASTNKDMQDECMV